MMTTHFEVAQGMERRMVVKLLRYWRELAGASRSYPSRSELDPRAMGDTWPSCFVLDHSEDRDDPAVEYVGEALGALCGAPDEGTPASAIAAQSLLAHAASRAGTAVSLKVPIVFGGEFRSHGGESLLYRGILAPLGVEPNGVTHLLGAASARVGPPG
jgi:hypothetical protein